MVRFRDSPPIAPPSQNPPLQDTTTKTQQKHNGPSAHREDVVEVLLLPGGRPVRGEQLPPLLDAPRQLLLHRRHCLLPGPRLHLELPPRLQEHDALLLGVGAPLLERLVRALEHGARRAVARLQGRQGGCGARSGGEPLFPTAAGAASSRRERGTPQGNRAGRRPQHSHSPPAGRPPVPPRPPPPAPAAAPPRSARTTATPAPRIPSCALSTDASTRTPRHTQARRAPTAFPSIAASPPLRALTCLVRLRSRS